MVPLAARSRVICLTVSIGIAKPTPTLASMPESAICELMPTTWPCWFSSGPPELPWLMAASVWITPLMPKPFGDVISRFRAETMPDVALRSRPNGLPIATTPSPTCSVDESPSGSGTSAAAGAVTFSSATSVELSNPTTFAGTRSSFEKDTVTAPPLVTTCAFVTTSPCRSSTKPDPSASPWLTWTTPGAAAR